MMSDVLCLLNRNTSESVIFVQLVYKTRKCTFIYLFINFFYIVVVVVFDYVIIITSES